MNCLDFVLYFILSDDHMCPVKSFMKYRGHLSESCTNLFQRPNARYHQTDEKWYNYPLGKNTIGQIMPSISQKAGLSTRYTNHSLHVTSTRGQDWMINPWLVKIEDSGKFVSQHCLVQVLSSL